MQRHHTKHGGRHDTRALPPGGFYFAPGSIDEDKPRPRRARRILGALAEVLILLAIGAAIGIAGGLIRVRGLL